MIRALSRLRYPLVARMIAEKTLSVLRGFRDERNFFNKWYEEHSGFDSIRMRFVPKVEALSF